MDKIELNKKVLQHVINKCKVEILNYKSDYVGIQYSNANGYYYIGEELYITYDGGCTGKSLKEIRLILFALPSLTKEIEVNGEKFVPIYKLCSMQGFSMPNIEACEISFHSEYNKTAMIKMDGWIFRYLNTENSFWLNGTEDWTKKHQKSNRQLEMFEKLYEWHFDLHSLIEKNLAIDINTIES